MRELELRKCMKCGAQVEVIENCTCENCGIRCCGEPMKKIEANSEDAAFEKHVPTYEIVRDSIVVRVNHVMEEDHYIEWIAMCSDKVNGKKLLKPGENPVVIFPYIPGSKVYSYCNKHGLWSTDVN